MHRDDFAFNSEGKVVAFTKLSCCGDIKSLTISSGQSLWPSMNFLIHVVQICFYTEFLQCSFSASFLVSLILVVTWSNKRRVNKWIFLCTFVQWLFDLLVVSGMNSTFKGNEYVRTSRGNIFCNEINII